MEAVISGQAGVALLVDGDALSSIHVHDPDTVVDRRAGEFHYLFGAASDLVFVEEVSLDDVRQELQAATDGEDVTQLTLLLLATDRSEEVRQLAAEELSDLLTANPQAAAFAERLLLSTALPQDADLAGALQLCSAGPARDFVTRLEKLQPSVRLARGAWHAIPGDFFGDSADDSRTAADAIFVREGVVRQFVLATAGELSAQSVLLSTLQIPAVRSLPNQRDIVTRWKANLTIDQETAKSPGVNEMLVKDAQWEEGGGHRLVTKRRRSMDRSKEPSTFGRRPKTWFEFEIEQLEIYARRAFDHGKQALDRNSKDGEALRHFQEANRLVNGDVPEYLLFEGLAHEQLEDLYAARECYARAIQLCPANVAEYYYALGRVECEQGNYEEAIDAFTRVIDLIESCKNRVEGLVHRIQPEDVYQRLAKTYVYRGRAREQQNKLDDALDDYSKAISLDGTFAEAYAQRGSLNDTQRNYAAAVMDFTAAIESIALYDEGTVYHRQYTFQRGCAYLHWRRFDEAIKDFGDVIDALNAAPTVCPDDEIGMDALYYRGLAKLNSQDYQGAINDLSIRIELDPSHSMSYRFRGRAYAKLDNEEAAARDYEKAEQRKPDFARAFFKRAMHRHNTDRRGAVQDLGRAVYFDDKYVDAYYNRGLLHQKDPTELDEAIKDFKTVKTIQPDHPYARFQLGQTYKMRGQFREEIAEYTQMIQSGHDFAFVYDARARAYCELGEIEKALKDFRKSKEISVRKRGVP